MAREQRVRWMQIPTPGWHSWYSDLTDRWVADRGGRLVGYVKRTWHGTYDAGIYGGSAWKDTYTTFDEAKKAVEQQLAIEDAERNQEG